jgi:hypothetical protein
MKVSIAALILIWAQASSTVAHELQGNRGTLVRRDAQHLTLTLFVDYTKVLHQLLAARSTLQEFTLMHSAMPPSEFQARLLKAQSQLQSSTRLVMSNGKTATLVQWVWPTPASVQKVLQQHAMQAVASPSDHTHESLMEIRAEAKSSHTGDFSAVSLQLPAALQQVLVVSYQPVQMLLAPNQISPLIKF